MSREVVFVKAKKDKIENIKKRYNNMEMSDETAAKLVRLDTVNGVLKAATGAVGLVTVVDLFVPDPVFGLDEAALLSLTGLLKYSSSVVSNKMEEIANSGNASLEMDEIGKLTGQLTDVVGKVRGSRGK